MRSDVYPGALPSPARIRHPEAARKKARCTGQTSEAGRRHLPSPRRGHWRPERDRHCSRSLGSKARQAGFAFTTAGEGQGACSAAWLGVKAETPPHPSKCPRELGHWLLGRSLPSSPRNHLPHEGRELTVLHPLPDAQTLLFPFYR